MFMIAEIGKPRAPRESNVNAPVAKKSPGSMTDIPFWKRKALQDMTPAEWEALCDGCARCCLVKLENEDDGVVFHTDVSCRLLDEGSCRCSDYENRAERIAGCVRLTPDNVARLAWLPPTCAYRLLAEGRDLYWWHPLVSGDPESVHLAGISVRGRVLTEGDVAEEELEDRIVAWPAEESPSR